MIVTGASGSVGSRIAQLAVERHHEVFTSYFTTGVRMGQPFRLDVTDGLQTLKAVSDIQPEVLVHSASLADVELCEAQQALAYRVNVEGCRNIVQAARSVGAYLLYVSTNGVFDGENGMYGEADEPNPINFYGQTMVEGERSVASSGLRYLISRTSMVYGSEPGRRGNFALWVLERLRRRESVSAIADQYVSPTLNTNLAEMVLEACARGLTGMIHLAGSTRASRYEFAVKLAETFELDRDLVTPARMNEMKWTAKRPRDYSLDVREAATLLRSKPMDLSRALDVLRRETQTSETGGGPDASHRLSHQSTLRPR